MLLRVDEVPVPDEPNGVGGPEDRQASSTANLRRANRQHLADLLAGGAEEWGEKEGLAFFANPFVDGGLITSFLAVRHLLSFYSVKRAVVFHPRTPQVEALRFSGHLRWHDLMLAGLSPRVSPIVRRTCDRHLIERLGEMAMGERTSLARAAGRPVIAQLKFDPEPRVFAALLINPRLIEDDLVSFIASGRSARGSLEMIARDRKWSVRSSVRLALLKNPATPPSVCVGFLTSLRKEDLLGIWRHPKTSELIRRAAQNVLEARLPGGRGQEREKEPR